MICSSYEYGQKMAEIKVNGRRPTYVSVGISVNTFAASYLNTRGLIIHA